ncbi:MAG: thiamine diphosphokinase [Ignavibacteria bacterium RBG_13_36_8]|nr:MAG: thiamine diphosphokinase [Ignavibacteria bacterium RBG_13_36_8]
MKRSIVFANGKPPNKSVISYLQRVGYNVLICADGGANYAYQLNLIPDYIIGDLDSIEPKIQKYFENKSKIIRYNRQIDTDVEKCLKFAIGKGCNDIILVGVTGDRLDHTFCNLGIVIKFFYKAKITIIHEKSVLMVLTGKVIFKTVAGEIISIYGLKTNTRISSRGLKYPLRNVSLPFGMKESTSNIAVSDIVELKIKNGIAFVIREYKVLKKNGFFQQS